jgi:hypothetical protein
MDSRLPNRVDNFLPNQNFQETDDQRESSMEFDLPMRGSSQEEIDSHQQTQHIDQGFQQQETEPEEYAQRVGA